MTLLRKYSLGPRMVASLFAITAAFCLVLLATGGALASTVNIYDDAHVLNASQVSAEAANLPDPVAIYTTKTFTGTT